MEDYFQVSGFADRIDVSSWDDRELRVEDSTRRVLALLRRRNVRGTFFILGWVADRCPSLVAEIAAAGHEIGSHGYWHQLVYDQTPGEFREDLRRSVDAIGAAGGGRTTCYRAPSFSITDCSRWAVDVLVEEGFTVDSSVFPVRRGRYGVPGASATIHRLAGPAGGELWEVPPTVVRVGAGRRGLNLPAAGGGYFRFFPESLTAAMQRRAAHGEGRPVIFYIHPWEVDPDQPRLPGTRMNRFRHYLNLNKTEGRLDRMLGRLPFGTLGEVVETHAAANGLSELSFQESASPPEWVAVGAGPC
ncbi:XrtA system polysaccharide deacetylase [Alienimonas californiensis]|uniref:XrtA system polysaccharide deacetylase n=1 Tax=Alienimonas californiensis TaxID=2527989 RepID=UPI001A983D23